MAAGAGRRFGLKPKALLQRDGESLLARQIRLLDEAGVRQVAVVLGHHAERLSSVVQRIAAARPHLDVRVALNPSPDDGPGSSLRCGLRALHAADDSAGSADAPGYLVLLADQPLLEVGDVSAMLRAKLAVSNALTSRIWAWPVWANSCIAARAKPASRWVCENSFTVVMLV